MVLANMVAIVKIRVIYQ